MSGQHSSTINQKIFKAHYLACPPKNLSSTGGHLNIDGEQIKGGFKMGGQCVAMKNNNNVGGDNTIHHMNNVPYFGAMTSVGGMGALQKSRAGI